MSLKSVSGDAHVSPPFRSVGKKTWRIGPGTDGGPSVSIKTVSGDLKARGELCEQTGRSTESYAVTPAVPTKPAVPPAPPAPAVPAEEPPEAKVDERLAVLQAVERGEIDIEEAMRRLDALG